MQLSSNVLIILNFARQQLIQLLESMTFPSSILVSIFACIALVAHVFTFSMSLSTMPQDKDILYDFLLSKVFCLSFESTNNSG